MTRPDQPGRLTTTERRVYRTYEAFAFFGPTCHPSQELVGLRCGLSREWVNKLTRRLVAKGYLTVGKARFIGSRWDHNVYHLAVWNPPHVKRVLRWLRGVRTRVRSGAVVVRLRSVHTKRTALAWQGPIAGVGKGIRAGDGVRAGPGKLQRARKLLSGRGYDDDFIRQVLASMVSGPETRSAPTEEGAERGVQSS